MTAEELYAACFRSGTGTGGRPAGTNPGTGVAVPSPWGSGRTSSGNIYPVTLWTPMESCCVTSGQGGYRILGDLLLDVERENRLETSRQLHRAGDSEQMEKMLESYENKTAQESYREAAGPGLPPVSGAAHPAQAGGAVRRGVGKTGLPVGRAAGRGFGHRPKGGAP